MKTLKPTILCIGNYLSSSKVNRNVWHELADRLGANGWKIIRISSKERKFARLLDILTTIWKQREHYQAAQIDVFSGPAFIFADLSSRLLALLRKPMLLTLHGGGLGALARKHPQRVKALLKRADKVVSPSAFLQVSLSSLREDIQVIPNPVDSQAYHFRLRQAPQPNLIWVRAFHLVYNPQLALRVAQALSADFPELTLTMLGPNKGDGSFEEFIALAQTLGLKDRLELAGGVPHSSIPDWLDEADIFVNTTNFDNTPVSVLEAMLSGLPIVSTDVGGLPYLITDGKDGLLVPPNDPQAMAAAIRRVLTEVGLAETLSANSRHKAVTFDWSIVLPQWEQAYTDLIAQSAK